MALIFFITVLSGAASDLVAGNSRLPRWLVEISEEQLPALALETEVVYLWQEQRLVYSSTII